MVVSLESEQVEYNRRVVLTSTIIVLFFSNGSYILRLLARRVQNQKLQLDDYLMGLALPFSYIPAVCLLYGLTVGLGEHVTSVSKVDLRKFNIVGKAPTCPNKFLTDLHQVALHSTARKPTMSLLRQIINLGSLLSSLQDQDI